MSANWTSRGEGGGRRALWLIRTIAMLFGRQVGRLCLIPITGYFLLRRGPERRASRAFLQRVLQRKVSLWWVARHLFWFAATILDRVYLLSEQFRRFEIRTHGLEELHRTLDLGRGVLLLGSHHGSFEVLRVLSLKRPDIKVRVVMDVGRNPAITALLDALNPTIAAGVIDAGRDGRSVVFDIADAMHHNCIVAVLADRVRDGETAVQAQFLGSDASFPASPWLIAAALKVPVALCFGLYSGGNTYDLHFEMFSEQLEIGRRDRQAVLASLVQRYAHRLEHYVRLSPLNWFNFYDFWQTRVPAAAAVSAGQPMGQQPGQ